MAEIGMCSKADCVPGGLRSCGPNETKLTKAENGKILQIMNLEELHKLTTNGFRPFKIYLSDGRSFDVPHPDYIAISRRVVVVIGDDELPNIIDPLHIVSAKPGEAKSGK